MFDDKNYQELPRIVKKKGQHRPVVDHKLCFSKGHVLRLDGIIIIHVLFHKVTYVVYQLIGMLQHVVCIHFHVLRNAAHSPFILTLWQAFICLWTITMLLMGKSTISMSIFSIAILT